MNKIIVDTWLESVHVTVSGDTAEEVAITTAELAIRSAGLLKSLTEVEAAVKAVGAFNGKKPADKVQDAPPVNKGQQPGKSDVPNCECGLPMSDVRGKTYQKGAKQGQPYPFAFYKSSDCKANCEARN